MREYERMWLWKTLVNPNKTVQTEQKLYQTDCCFFTQLKQNPIEVHAFLQPSSTCCHPLGWTLGTADGWMTISWLLPHAIRSSLGLRIKVLLRKTDTNTHFIFKWPWRKRVCRGQGFFPPPDNNYSLQEWVGGIGTQTSFLLLSLNSLAAPVLFQTFLKENKSESSHILSHSILSPTLR